MALSDNSQPNTRSIPRWVAYPVLFLVPITCIYLGIILGRDGHGSSLMLASRNQTPVENWVISLIGLAIALFMYFNVAYSTRDYTVRPFTLILVITYLIVLFVFGVFGLYALAALGMTWYLACYKTIRRARQSTPHDDAEGDGE